MMLHNEFLLVVVALLVRLSTCLDCDSPFICSNRTLTTVTEGIDVITKAQGYKSIYGQGASIFNRNCSQFGCYGSRSCQRMSFVHVGCNIEAHGTQSLSYISDIIASGSISCLAVASCIHSTLTASSVYCHGGQSCSNTVIKATPQVEASAAYSILNSIIYSNRTNISIELEGYHAGYNLTIICEKHDTCALTCHGNACLKTFFKCHSDSVCIVNNCDNNVIDCPEKSIYNDTHSYTLPDANDLVFVNQQSDILSESSSSNFSNFSLLFDFIELTDRINDECDSNPNALVWDNFEGSGDASNAIGPICCRARRARGNGQMSQNSVVNGVVFCAGLESCYRRITISGINGTVYCIAKQVCQYRTIEFLNTGGILYCSGDESCAYAKVYNASAVYCDGSRLHCSDMTIIGVPTIYGLGSGYYPATRSNWISGGVGNFTVYLMTHHIGRNLNIYCNYTDQCTIFCGMCLR